MDGFARVLIITNLDKDPKLHLTAGLGEHIQAGGREMRQLTLTPETGDDQLAELARWADIAIILGGDGTLLRAARRAAATGTPLLGINLGHLGFLTEAEEPEAYEAVDEILGGRYTLDERLMLEVSLRRGGKVHATYLALNEAVIAKGPLARMIEVVAYVDNLNVATYPADGIILATPTGSTAYSLSAGGPVVHPNLDVLLLTPICPHTLYARALMVSAQSEVRVPLGRCLSATLTVDGQEGTMLEPGDEVVVTRAAVAARLVRREGWSFYDVVRRKFQGASLRGDRQ